MTEAKFNQLPKFLSLEEMAEAFEITNEMAHTFLKDRGIARIIYNNTRMKISKNDLADFVKFVD